jgi:hypothetical protein
MRHETLDLLHAAIRDMLLRDWDPIGIGGVPEALDEYDAYTTPIAGMLASGKPIPDISAYLCRIEREQLGLAADPQRAGIVALRLKALRSVS